MHDQLLSAEGKKGTQISLVKSSTLTSEKKKCLARNLDQLVRMDRNILLDGSLKKGIRFLQAQTKWLESLLQNEEHVDLCM